LNATATYGVTLSGEQAKEIEAFIHRVKNAPTTYFEAKILRPVKFSEFRCAVIPSNSVKYVEPILRSAGMDSIFVYEKNNDDDRLEKLQEAFDLVMDDGEDQINEEDFVDSPRM